VRDTKCNGKSAYAEVRIYREHGQLITRVSFTNSAGCDTVRSYDTEVFSVGERVINIRVCADGDGNGGSLTCGNYQDNPYT
jgi:hypothetical protein